MMIFGVLLSIFGVILYSGGVDINNDMDAQMESIFSNGVANPGSTQETVGIVLLISGILLIIIGIAKKYNQRPHNDEPVENKPIEPPECGQNALTKENRCAYCGAILSDESIFCSTCGQKNSNFISCPNCGQRISAGSVYCDSCGAEIILYKFSLQNSAVAAIIDVAFQCLSKSDFEHAKELLDSADKKSPENARISLGRLLLNYKLHAAEELADIKDELSKNVYFRNIMSSDDEVLKEQIVVYYTYSKACVQMNRRNYDDALEGFDKLGEWRDSKQKAECCRQKKAERERKANEERLRQLRKAKKRRLIGIVILAIFAVGIIAGVVYNAVIAPSIKYNEANGLLQNQEYEEAYDILVTIRGFKDVDEILDQFKALPQTEWETTCGEEEKQYLIKYVYDSEGRIAAKERRRYIDGVKGAAVECRYTYSYDSDGKCLGEQQTWLDGSSYNIEYSYDSKGNLIESIKSGSYGVHIDKTYTYDENGRCSESEEEQYDYFLESIDTCIYIYDAKGDCIREEHVVFDYNKGQGEESSYSCSFTYEYNEKEQLVKMTEVTPDGTSLYEYSDFKIFYIEK
ncbi:MAG: zinc ribbon domain-containing protein [Ruminococcaceae bacterium]|nr:zinc ribbon domain-containing protein [Oscillospiraceae bacterium]